jgi:hypothetical protein
MHRGCLCPSFRGSLNFKRGQTTKRFPTPRGPPTSSPNRSSISDIERGRRYPIPGALGASSPTRATGINQGRFSKVILQTDPLPPLDSWNKKGTNVLLMFLYREADMLKVFVEEAAALASIVLFVGMIAVWAQLIPQL